MTTAAAKATPEITAEDIPWGEPPAGVNLSAAEAAIDRIAAAGLLDDAAVIEHVKAHLLPVLRRLDPVSRDAASVTAAERLPGITVAGLRASLREHEQILAQLEAEVDELRGDAGKVRVYTLEEYLSLKMKPRALLLEPVIREKDLVMAYGYRGVGKTFFALAIGLAVATGTRFLEWCAPESASVLLVDGEMPVETLQQRVASLLASIDTKMEIGDIPFRILAADAQTGPLPSLDTPDGQTIVDDALGDAKLVILDNISTLMGAGPENDAEAWEPAQRFLLSLRRRGVAVLLVHHAGKAGTQRGTSRREDVLDTVIKLERPRDYRAEQGARFEVTFEKARGLIGQDIAPFEAQLLRTEAGLFQWSTAHLDGRNKERVVEMLAEGMKPNDIAAELGINRSTVYRHRAAAGKDS